MIGGQPAIRRIAPAEPLLVGGPFVHVDALGDAEPDGVGVVLVRLFQIELGLLNLFHGVLVILLFVG